MELQSRIVGMKKKSSVGVCVALTIDPGVCLRDRNIVLKTFDRFGRDF